MILTEQTFNSHTLSMGRCVLMTASAPFSRVCWGVSSASAYGLRYGHPLRHHLINREC